MCDEYRNKCHQTRRAGVAAELFVITVFPPSCAVLPHSLSIHQGGGGQGAEGTAEDTERRLSGRRLGWRQSEGQRPTTGPTDRPIKLVLCNMYYSCCLSLSAVGAAAACLPACPKPQSRKMSSTSSLRNSPPHPVQYSDGRSTFAGRLQR